MKFSVLVPVEYDDDDEMEDILDKWVFSCFHPHYKLVLTPEREADERTA